MQEYGVAEQHTAVQHDRYHGAQVLLDTASVHCTVQQANLAGSCSVQLLRCAAPAAPCALEQE